jgi:predicted GH43/DUF377 family glycosyl hydrolase
MLKITITANLVLWNFILIAQENWTKYTNNPVLTRDTVVSEFPNDIYAISDCFVLKDGGIYKMWYTCGGFNVPEDDYNLKSRICYCESENGIDWIKSEANPVVDIAYLDDIAWEKIAVETATVLIDEEADPTQRYQMWYSGIGLIDGVYEIGQAVSADGLVWVKYWEPVLPIQSLESWDSGFLEGPSVIKNETGYHMWYAAYDGYFNGQVTDGKVCIGYATSDNGLDWVRYSDEPVMMPDADSWESVYVQDPHVIYYNDQYHMWYGGVDHYDYFGQQVGYAVSDDGINWTKSPANPVLTLGEAGSWDANTSSFPSVLLDGNQLKMWYTGKSIEPLPEESLDYYWEIGYATGDEVVLAVDDHVSDNKELIYPNPFQESFQITSDFRNSWVEMYNLQGQKVFEKMVDMDNNKINASLLPNGTYLLVVRSNNQHNAQYIIKNN